MTFKPHELDFMRQAELGRLATIQRDGTPQNSPVAFTYNEALDTAIIRITPRRIISFGIDDQVSEPHQLEVERRDA